MKTSNRNHTNHLKGRPSLSAFAETISGYQPTQVRYEECNFRVHHTELTSHSDCPYTRTIHRT